MKSTDFLKLCSVILLCEAAGLVGSLFTLSSVNTWYTTLKQPAFTPPDWLFGPVWTLLYLLMGIAAYLIWKKGFAKKPVRLALKLFALQLLLNVLWSILFFGLESPALALIEIVFLWPAILLTLIDFYKLDKRASYLLAPYLAWVSFATVLNLSLWILN